MSKPWRHTLADGRGLRAVYLDGQRIERAVYADERRGIVKVYDNPPQFRHGSFEIVTRVKRGHVEVRPL